LLSSTSTGFRLLTVSVRPLSTSSGSSSCHTKGEGDGIEGQVCQMSKNCLALDLPCDYDQQPEEVAKWAQSVRFSLNVAPQPTRENRVNPGPFSSSSSCIRCFSYPRPRWRGKTVFNSAPRPTIGFWKTTFFGSRKAKTKKPKILPARFCPPKKPRGPSAVKYSAETLHCLSGTNGARI
jgi:hypothetical protein